MKNPGFFCCLLLSGILVLGIWPQDSLASGPSLPHAHFWSTRVPGEALENFQSGRLGILDESLGRAYLYIAYRYLIGLGLDAESQKAVSIFFKPKVPTEDPFRIWKKSRLEIPAVKPIPSLIRMRWVEEEDADYVYSFPYLNCQDDAFVNAAKILADRVQRFGLKSRELLLWLDGQDQVFSNCGKETVIPEPLGPQWNELLRADRAYQIAAAYFYSGNFDEAAEHFRLISENRDSPWSTLSAYLVARALVRKALVGVGPREETLSTAESTLIELLDNPSRSAIHPSANRLLAYVQIRLYPKERFQRLENVLLQKKVGANLKQDLTDYFWLLLRPPNRSEFEVGELTDWLLTIRIRSTTDREHALRKWRENGALPWLTAALMKARPNVDDLDSILREASKVSPESPAYLTLAYHRVRLLIERGQLDQARDDLDKLFKDMDDKLSLSDRNRLLELRTRAAKDLAEFIRYSQEIPVRISGRYRPPGTGEDPLNAYRNGQKFLGGHAVSVMNRWFTPALLLQSVRNQELDPRLRRRLAIAGWARAVLVGNDEIASELASHTIEIAPDLHEELEAYLSADPGQAKEFSAAFTFLRFPGMSPLVPANLGRFTPIESIDSLRRNWWCRGTTPVKKTKPPLFLSQMEIKEAGAVMKQMEALEPGPIYLGRAVLSWAKSHPDDLRVPEALHRVVKATRYGCRRESYGDLSKEAFQLLHNRYPSSPWTAQTRNWYN